MILENTVQALEVAAKISDKVHLSSIIPRTDNGQAQLKAENTNRRLKDMCLRMPKVTFIDHDTNFLLSDKSPNDACLEGDDGLHLNQYGCQKLIKNLGINATFRNRNQHINFKSTNSRPDARQKSYSQRFQAWNYNSTPAPSNQQSTQYHFRPVQMPNFGHSQQNIYHQSNMQYTQQPFVQQLPRYTALPTYTTTTQPPVMPHNLIQPVTCSRCGRNHAVSQCQVDPYITCFSCGSTGHTGAVCGNYGTTRS